MKAGVNFTLVELLICCAIIMVMGSLLLPALNKARLAASKTHCLNTLKQLGVAENSYSFCNDGFMLPAMSDDKGWAELLSSYAGTLCQRKNKSDGLQAVAVPLCSRSISEDGRKINARNADKFTLWNDDGTVDEDMGGFARWIEMGGYNSAYPFVKMARLRSPSEKITLFDGYYHIAVLMSQFDNPPEEGITAWGIHETDRINTLSADGHASSMQRCRMDDLSGGISVKQRHFQP